MINIGAYSKPNYRLIINNGIETSLTATNNVTLGIELTKYIYAILDTPVQLLTEAALGLTAESGEYLIAEE